MNTCVILNSYRDGGVGIWRRDYVRFLFVSWVEERSLRTKVGYWRRIALILDDSTRVKKREDQLRQTTRNLHIRVAKCIEVGCTIFEYLL
jgi:hypothetical protein